MTRNTDTLTIFPPDVGIGAVTSGHTLGIETNQSPNYWYSRLRGWSTLSSSVRSSSCVETGGSVMGNITRRAFLKGSTVCL